MDHFFLFKGGKQLIEFDIYDIIYIFINLIDRQGVLWISGTDCIMRQTVCVSAE